MHAKLLLITCEWFHVKLKYTIMNLADLFLCVGEKCDELVEAGIQPFFHYSGHVHNFNVYCYRDNVINVDQIILDTNRFNFKTDGEWLQAFQNSANLLILEKS